MTLMQAALACFTLSLVTGIGMVYLRHTQPKTPLPASFIHGGLGLIGLVLVALAATLKPTAGLALMLLMLAAGVGVSMFAYDRKHDDRPTRPLIAHMLLAVAGFISLVVVVSDLAN